MEKTWATWATIGIGCALLCACGGGAFEASADAGCGTPGCELEAPDARSADAAADAADVADAHGGADAEREAASDAGKDAAPPEPTCCATAGGIDSCGTGSFLCAETGAQCGACPIGSACAWVSEYGDAAGGTVVACP